MKAGTSCALSTDIIEPSTAFSSICATQRKLLPWNLRSWTASEIGTEPGIEIPPLLNGRQTVLEGVHVAGSSLLPFNPAISFCPGCRDSFSDDRFIIAK